MTNNLYYLNIILMAAVAVAIAAYMKQSSPAPDKILATAALKGKGKKAVQAAASSSGVFPSKLGWVLFAVLMALALAVRLWKFGLVPGGFNQDGAMAAVDAHALADYATDRFGTHMPAHLYAWGFGQMSSLLSYMMVPFIKLFGLNAVTARLPLLVCSMLALWVLYLLIKDMYGHKSALVVLAFAAINPWHFMQSRWALDANLLPHFMLFSIYFLQKGTKKIAYAYVSMIFFGLTMYTYGIAFYLVPIFLIIACVIFLKKKVFSLKQAVVMTAVYFLIAWPIFGVILVNTLKLNTISLPFVTIQYFKDSMRSNDLLFFSKEPMKQLLVNAKSLMDVVFLQKPDLLWNSIEAFGSIYLFSMPFTLLGFYKLVKDSKDKAVAQRPAFWLVLLWICVSIFSGFVVRQVNVNRINIIFYPMIIFTGIGIYYLCSLRIFKNKRVIAAALAALYACYFLMFCNTYFGTHNEKLSEAFYEGFGDAVCAAEDTGYDKINITAYTQGQNSYYISEILTQFYLALDAKYIRGEKGMTDKSGGALSAYRQRFSYVSFAGSPPNPSVKNTAYVVNNKELSLFDSAEFHIRQFKYYSMAIPK